jgi:hypothetical protein
MVDSEMRRDAEMRQTGAYPKADQGDGTKRWERMKVCLSDFQRDRWSSTVPYNIVTGNKQVAADKAMSSLDPMTLIEAWEPQLWARG